MNYLIQSSKEHIRKILITLFFQVKKLRPGEVLKIFQGFSCSSCRNEIPTKKLSQSFILHSCDPQLPISGITTHFYLSIHLILFKNIYVHLLKRKIHKHTHTIFHLLVSFLQRLKQLWLGQAAVRSPVLHPGFPKGWQRSKDSIHYLLLPKTY